MNDRTTKDGLYLLGGALVGAAAIYLLDPDNGQRRRARIAKAADDARHSVTDHLGDISSRAKVLTHQLADRAAHLHDDAAAYAQHMADQARGITSDYAGQAHEGASHLRDLGARLWGQARHLGAKAADVRGALSHHAHDIHDDLEHRAGDWGHWLSDRGNKAASRAPGLAIRKKATDWARARPSPLPSGAVPSARARCISSTPRSGESRRAWAGQAMSQCLRSTANAIFSTGHDVAHRLSGMFYRTRSKARGTLRVAKIDSVQLLERIRESVSHYVTQANQIQFMADADGTVTVTGQLRREQLDGLLKLLHGIPGVSHIINRLEVREGEHHNGPRENVEVTAKM